MVKQNYQKHDNDTRLRFLDWEVHKPIVTFQSLSILIRALSRKTARPNCGDFLASSQNVATSSSETSDQGQLFCGSCQVDLIPIDAEPATERNWTLHLISHLPSLFGYKFQIDENFRF